MHLQLKQMILINQYSLIFYYHSYEIFYQLCIFVFIDLLHHKYFLYLLKLWNKYFSITLKDYMNFILFTELKFN